MATSKTSGGVPTYYYSDPEVVAARESEIPKYIVSEEYPKYIVEEEPKYVVEEHPKYVVEEYPKYDAGQTPPAQTEAKAVELGSNPTQGKGWWRERQRNKWCIVLEAAIATLIVVAIVVGAVVGTEVQKQNSASSTDSDTSATESNNSIPIGRTFKSSFALPGANCSNPCGTTISGYTAGISQNLFYDGASGSTAGSSTAWGCGTCWEVNPQTDGDGVALTNASVVTVQAITICPATVGNELCQMQNFSSSAVNVHNATVHFNLCEDTGTSIAAFGSSEIGLAIGTVTRVECP